MSTFDLAASFERASKRLVTRRKRRADAGRARIHPAIEARLKSRLHEHERPDVRVLQRELATLCKRSGLRPPSRATIYNATARCRPASYHASQLPASVRHSLYNVDLGAAIPAEQIVFYAYNYGDLRAVTWASAMPWLALFHAARLRGWRPKSLSLLRAAMRWRGIP